MDDHHASEEKFFKLIKKKQKSSQGAENSLASTDSEDQKQKVFNKYFFKKCNQVLSGICIVLLAIMVYKYLTYNKDYMKARSANRGGSTQNQIDVDRYIGTTKTFNYYLKKLNDRNIFQQQVEKAPPVARPKPQTQRRMPQARREPEADPLTRPTPQKGPTRPTGPQKTNPPETRKVDYGAKIKGELLLLGIVLDKNPQAIVENRKTKETLFLSIGDEVNNAVLHAVYEGRAVFKIENQMVDLTNEK